jgi:hypothetical protein
VARIKYPERGVEIPAPHALYYLQEKKFMTDLTLEEILEKTVQTYEEGGKGKKQCQNPTCKKYVGARTPVCVCGFDFANYVKSADQQVELTPEQKRDRRLALKLNFNRFTPVVVPAGKCPISLTDLDNDIEMFCTLVVEAGRPYRLYTPSAIKYWLRSFFDVNSAEYTEACTKVEDWVSILLTEVEYE